MLARLWRVLKSLLIDLAHALVRLVSLLILILIWLFRLLLRLFRGISERGNRRMPCADVPVHIKRRPDPCLYSQSFITANFPGTPVTWDNPDIWLTELNGTPVPSHQLQPDHVYVVHGRIYDASFDPAIATRVRCRFRNWGFSSSTFEPVERNTDGTEKVVTLHIPAWGNREATFRWRTPTAGHYCIQVECQHADDRQPANNIGQENTDVLPAAAGQTVTQQAMLYNDDRRRRAQVRISVDAYTIPEGRIELRLDTKRQVLGGEGWLPVYNKRTETTRFPRRLGPTYLAWVYRGIDRVLRANAAGFRSLPDGWHVRADGKDLEARLELAPGEQRNVSLEIALAPTARRGERVPLNFNAWDDRSRLIGGFTVFIEVT